MKPVKDLIHKRILKNKTRVQDWFEEKSKGLSFPIYSSIDVRDAGFKLAPVDANIFPAGFNNICDVDLDFDRSLMRDYLTKHYKSSSLKILLLTEEHTSNRFYWENVRTLQGIFQEAGAEVRVAVPKEFKGVFEALAAGGAKVRVHSARREGSGVSVDGFVPELIVSNNDFSDPHEDWYKGLQVPMNPNHDLGWFRRKKSDHFKYYNQLASEFCAILDLEPWTFTVETELVASVNLDDRASVELLAQKTQKMLDAAKETYRSRKVDTEPVVFIKNNRGTYGMGIIVARSAEDILKLSGKDKKKANYAKGGASMSEVILQEGVPSEVLADGIVGEPVIYLVGCELAGGFIRAHKEKGRNDNLNSPGSVFKKLCMSDLIVNVEGSPLENVYGTIGRLSNLAIALESRDVGARYGVS